MGNPERRDRLGLLQKDEGAKKPDGPNHETEEDEKSGCHHRSGHKKSIVEKVKGDGYDESDEKPKFLALELRLRQIVAQNT